MPPKCKKYSLNLLWGHSKVIQMGSVFFPNVRSNLIEWFLGLMMVKFVFGISVKGKLWSLFTTIKTVSRGYLSRKMVNDSFPPQLISLFYFMTSKKCLLRKMKSVFMGISGWEKTKDRHLSRWQNTLVVA